MVAPWKRLRVMVPWAYPREPPVPVFASQDPSYNHPYGRAARLHYQVRRPTSRCAAGGRGLPGAGTPHGARAGRDRTVLATAWPPPSGV